MRVSHLNMFLRCSKTNIEEHEKSGLPGLESTEIVGAHRHSDYTGT